VVIDYLLEVSRNAKEMTAGTITTGQPQRSNEYVQLIKQLKHSMTGTADIALRLFEQG
jgi:hypothetical protein